MDVKHVTLEEALERLRTRPLIDIWPDTAVLLDCGKGTAYELAKRGELETLRVGRLRKVIAAPLRKKLGI
jgi:excisionase family DNA binding protein